ncbi:hypothetical protein HGRIS_014270 [Hohenbuehelia grisea]|uniref:NAD(P)-binding protein n=1 Tax=Hohenbuehelia grisea TaxID=104357 RepID=A0ABR3JUN2_9AGAR
MSSSLVWLVTGSSQGLGRRVVRSALARGDKVIATLRALDKAPDLIEEAQNNPDTLRVLQLDVTSGGHKIKAVVKEAVQCWGRIDVLINNAGYGFPCIAEEGGTEWLRLQFETNFFGLAEVTHAVLPHMRQRREGTIVNMGSRSAWRTELPFAAPYAASKAAVRAYTETLSVEVAQFNIRVLLVEPGGFLTEGAYTYPQLQANLIPDYDSLRAAASSGFHSIRSKIQGDPDKAMDVLVDVVRGEGQAAGRPWPGLLVLGEDGEADIRKKIAKVTTVLDAWSDVANSVSIDRG